MTVDEDTEIPHSNVRREDKVVFARWVISVMQETKLWQRAVGPIQAKATAETYEALINHSDQDILEVLDMAFADLVANFRHEEELEGAMEIVAMDGSLLALDSELKTKLERSSLDQARFLIMACAAGDAAEARGLLEKPRVPASGQIAGDS